MSINDFMVLMMYLLFSFGVVMYILLAHFQLLAYMTATMDVKRWVTAIHLITLLGPLSLCFFLCKPLVIAILVYYGLYMMFVFIPSEIIDGYILGEFDHSNFYIHNIRHFFTPNSKYINKSKNYFDTRYTQSDRDEVFEKCHELYEYLMLYSENRATFSFVRIDNIYMSNNNNIITFYDFLHHLHKTDNGHLYIKIEDYRWNEHGCLRNSTYKIIVKADGLYYSCDAFTEKITIYDNDILGSLKNKYTCLS